jgi:hypothetical protein
LSFGPEESVSSTSFRGAAASPRDGRPARRTTAAAGCGLLTLSVLVAFATGCAQWSADLSEENILPVPRMSPDTVVLEQVFLTMEEGQVDLDAELWSVLDEQPLSTEVRRRLLRNGFRGGLLGTQLPAALQDLLANQPDVVQSLSEATNGQAVDMVHRPQRRQLRSGRRAQILAGQDVRESLVVLLRDEDGAVRGDTFPQAQCMFSMTSHPQGDGRVRLELTPEIQFGQPKQGWVGHEGAFRWDAERQRRIFDDLRMEVTLAAGQTFVLSSTADAAGLGRQFFNSEGAEKKTQRILLIRLAQTQFDDLFAPDRMIEPIATPTP